jgi:hypothetical protein
VFFVKGIGAVGQLSADPASNTSATLVDAWTGASVSGAVYEVWPQNDPAVYAKRVRDLLNSLAVPKTGQNMTFDGSSTTAGDPGAGKVRASATSNPTALYISYTDADGNDITNLVKAVDDVVNALSRASLTFRPTDGALAFLDLNVTGAITDNTTYATVPVSVRAGSVPADKAALAMAAVPAGADGQDGTTIAASRTDLKAIDTGLGTTTAILAEAGREGIFNLRSGDYSAQVTADTNEGIYIEADDTPSTSGAWVRSYDGEVFANWFGAKGDGATDDTSAIKAAIALLAPATIGSGSVYTRSPILAFQPGSYLLSDEIGVNNNLVLEAKGLVTFTGNVSSTTHKCGFYLGDSSYLSNNNGYWEITLRGLSFNLSGHDYCALSKGIRTPRFEDCHFAGGAAASLRVEQAWNNGWARGCSFAGPGAGSATVGAYVTDSSNIFVLDGNYFAGYANASSIAAVVRDSSGVKVLSNDFEYNANQLLVYAASTNCNNICVEHNWFEGASQFNVKFDNTSNGFAGTSFINNSVYGTPTGNLEFGVTGGTGVFTGAIIAANTFNSPSTLNMPSASANYVDAKVLGNLPATVNTDINGSVGTTDNRLVRSDGTGGRTLQSTGISADDSNNLSGVAQLTTSSSVFPTFQSADNFSGGVFVRKRGKSGDSTAAINVGEIGYHSFYGWDGSAYNRGAYAIVKATEQWSGTARGCSYELYTTPNGSTTNTHALKVDQDGKVSFDFDVTGAGAVKSSAATSGVGYATGAGGAVTQATSKSTGVTLNKASGQITMNGAALAAGAKVSFVVTDSAVAATDAVVVAVGSGGTANAYRAAVTAVAAGSFTITVENITAGSLSEAPVINFAVIKAVAA